MVSERTEPISQLFFIVQATNKRRRYQNKLCSRKSTANRSNQRHTQCVCVCVWMVTQRKWRIHPIDYNFIVLISVSYFRCRCRGCYAHDVAYVNKRCMQEKKTRKKNTNKNNDSKTIAFIVGCITVCSCMGLRVNFTSWSRKITFWIEATIRMALTITFQCQMHFYYHTVNHRILCNFFFIEFA